MGRAEDFVRGGSQRVVVIGHHDRDANFVVFKRRTAVV